MKTLQIIWVNQRLCTCTAIHTLLFGRTRSGHTKKRPKKALQKVKADANWKTKHNPGLVTNSLAVA